MKLNTTILLAGLALTAIVAEAEWQAPEWKNRPTFSLASQQSRQTFSLDKAASKQPVQVTKRDSLDQEAAELNHRRNAAMRSISAGPDKRNNLIIDDGTRIVGHVSTSGTDLVGMASIRPIAGTYPEVFAQNVGIGTQPCYDGEYYYTKQYSAGGGLVMQCSFQAYETQTWTLAYEAKLPETWASVTLYMAYNPHDGQLWGIGYDGFRRQYLVTVDKKTGEQTFMTQEPMRVNFKAIAFDQEGELFGLTDQGELASIDLNNGYNTTICQVPEVKDHRLCDLTYDNHTKTFYFSVLREKWGSHLYSIDRTTGQVALVSDLPMYCQLTGLYMITPQANDKAPNTVAALNVNFGAQGSCEGEICITAPSTTFDGSALEGQLEVKIYVDGSMVKSAAQEAGSTLTFVHDFATEGEHEVAVVYSNANGESPRGWIKPFCGIDTPANVTSFTMVCDDQTGVVNLNWQPSTEGIHQGYMDADAVTYNVVRQPGNKLLASGLKETSYTDQLSGEVAPTRYHYEVSPVCNDRVGDAVVSDDLVYGKALETPVHEQLGSDYFSTLLTYVNNDGHGDGYYPGWGVVFVNCGAWNETFTNDKWLYSPAIHLKKGNYYYRLQHQRGDFELSYGKQRSPEGQTHRIGDIPEHGCEFDYETYDDISYNAGYTAFITYKRMIFIEEEGDYYFGFHWNPIYHNGDYLNSMLRTFEIKEGPKDGAPDVCTNTSAKTFPKGELMNNVTYTTPTTDTRGNKLTTIDRVEIMTATTERDPLSGQMRNTVKLVGTEQGPLEPGKQYTTAVPAIQGNNLYYITACNEEGNGTETELAVWAGVDYPSHVENGTYEVIDNRDIVMNWTAPSELGLNGGYVDSTKLVYNMGVAIDYIYGLSTLAKTREKSFTFLGELGEQYKYYYGVTPENELGEGSPMMAGIVIGTPYGIPFKESFNFPNGYLQTSVWDMLPVQGPAMWNAYRVSPDASIAPYDNDGGMLLYTGNNNEPSMAGMVTPILTITGAVKPTLSFQFWHNPQIRDEYAGVSIYASVNDNLEDNPIASIPLNNGPQSQGWTHYEIDLSKYAGQERVCFFFMASSSKSQSIIAVDDVELYDNIPLDLSVESLLTPAKIAPNEDNEIVATVLNRGREALSNYSVELYADGEKIAEQVGTPLNFGRTADLAIHFLPAAKTFGTQVNYEVRAKLEGDGNPANDAVQKSIGVNTTLLPAPSALTHSLEGNVVTLNWEAPAEPTWVQVREDWENYETFIIDNIGQWSVYDGDKQLSSAPNSGDGTAPNFPNNWCAKSWQTWNPTGLQLVSGLRGNVLKMYGNQCLISFDAQAFYPDFSAAEAAKTDDWLISPRVAGGTKLKFYAKQADLNSTEKFEVLVSYGTSKIQDFDEIATDEVHSTSSKKFEYTLPVDAHYFAIRNITKDGFLMMIDNIDYTPGYTDIELLGYNIYADGVKVNDEPVAALTFTHESNKPVKYYGVTAVYDYDGESEMILDLVNGIKTITTDSGAEIVLTEQGIQIKGAAGQTAYVYNLQGQLEVRRLIVTDKDFCRLAAGVYVVRLGSQEWKIRL